MVEGFDVNDLRSEVMRHEQERYKDLKNAGSAQLGAGYSVGLWWAFR